MLWKGVHRINMNKEIKIEPSVEKDYVINEEKLSEEPNILQNEDNQPKENEIDVLKNHLKKLLYNSSIAENYDKNLLNLKIEFFINMKDYVKRVKELNINLKNIENFNTNTPKIFVTNIEFILFLLKNISMDNIEEFNLENFLLSLKKSSFEKNIENINNNFAEIVKEENLKKYFEKMINFIEIILEKNYEDNLQNETLSKEDGIEKIKYKLAFNFLEEICQESEIVLYLTNSFLKYTVWLESLLEIILEKPKQEILDENIVVLLEKVFMVSEKILKNKIIDFDSDEMTNSLEGIIALEQDIQKNYKKIVNLDNVYNFSNNYLIEKFPHLEGKLDIFVSKEKKTEYIKIIPLLLMELDKNMTKESSRIRSFFDFTEKTENINYLDDEEVLQSIKKIIRYFSLVSKKNLLINEIEEMELIKKINVRIKEKQESYENEIKKLKKIENLSENDDMMLQKYENTLYWFRSFKKISKRFITDENIEEKTDISEVSKEGNDGE